MEIVKPRSEYCEEYAKAVQESYDNNIVDWMPPNPVNFEHWQERILERYSNCEKGINLPENTPRVYTYWCVEEDHFIGEIQLRPFLTEEEAMAIGHLSYAVRYSKWQSGYGTKLLKDGLEKIKEFQINKVYITCKEDNLGSIRVIEKNNGKFVEKIKSTEGEMHNLYYVVNLI